jgi:hypothetical protein
MSTLNSNLSQFEKKDKAWKLKYYSFLKGAKILNVEIFEDHSFDGPNKNWVVITIEKDGVKYELQPSRDEEGNAPGFIFGLPHVQV